MNIIVIIIISINYQINLMIFIEINIVNFLPSTN